jgi:hypothetical protein
MGDELRYQTDGDAAVEPRLTKCADLLPGYTVFRYSAPNGALVLCTVPTAAADSTEVESAVIAAGEAVAAIVIPHRQGGPRLMLMQDAL